MNGHAFLAPSFAPIWGHCAGAPLAASQMPPDDSDAAREGTAAHWAAATVLQGGGTAAQLVGATAANGVVVDSGMAESAQVFIDEVAAVLAATPVDCRVLLIERPVRAPSIHPEHAYGTPDAVLVVLRDGRPVFVYVWDFKHGHGEVSARGNFQLVSYLAGVMNEFGIVDDLAVVFSARVVQPRAYRSSGPVDEWRGALADVRPYVNTLAHQAEEAVGPAPTLSAGAWCRYCPARAACTASKAQAYALGDLARMPYAMDAMPLNALATERRIILDAIEGAKGRLDAIEDTLTHALREGRAVGGLKLETGYGRKRFTCPPEEAEALAAQFGFSIKKPDVLTPAQAVAKAPLAVRPYFEQTIKQFTETPVTGLKLTNAADSKTAAAFR